MLYCFGDYELDDARRELYRKGRPITIEPKAYDVLLYLLANRERVVSKEELLTHCWPETFVSEAALTRCLAKVRRAVQTDQDDAPLIKTLYGQGYRFVGSVTSVSAKPEPSNALTKLRASWATTQLSTILIVDDDPYNVHYLKYELEALGYKTISATNGREALDQVATEAPDLILLDVMMPVLDGWQVCRTLKADDETRLIPIIMMTALDATEDRVQGIKAGADDFLTKPVNEEELLARIETALKLKQTIDRKIGELHKLKDHMSQMARIIRDLPT